MLLSDESMRVSAPKKTRERKSSSPVQMVEQREERLKIETELGVLLTLPKQLNFFIPWFYWCP